MKRQQIMVNYHRIVKCIESCTSEDQLSVCKEAINNFVKMHTGNMIASVLKDDLNALYENALYEIV